MKSIQKSFNDDEFLIVFESEPNEDESFHWVDFRIYEIVTIDRKPMFNKNGYTGFGEWVENLEDAQIYLVGFLKWDGCCEFEIKDHVHFCGRRMAHMLTRMIDAIYDTAISEFGFSGEKIR